MATLTPSPKMQFFTSNGVPLSGGKLYTYAAGTTTPLATYTDSTGSTPNTNPIILNARGEASVWLGTSLYYMELKDASDVLIWTADNIGGVATLAALAASGGSSLVGFIQTGTGSVATTSQEKLRQWVSVTDYMTSAQIADVKARTALVDVSGAVQAAINVSNFVLFPFDGIYAISTGLTFPRSGITLYGLSSGGFARDTCIKYIGVAGATMVYVATGMHSPAVVNMSFDANALANICVHFDVAASSSMFMPRLENVDFRGYLTRGFVLGSNDTTTLSNGQTQLAHMKNVSFYGGGAAGTIGWLLNAQNCEFAVCEGIYFDPWPGGGYFNHNTHIFSRSGGLHIKGLATTRADSYAIESYEQCIIDGWRSEDLLLLRTYAVNPNGPISLNNIMQRPGATGGTNVIVINSASQPISITNSTLRGKVSVASASDKYLKTSNLNFVFAGDGVSRSGGLPVATNWIDENVQTGTTIIQAADPTEIQRDLSEVILYRNRSGHLIVVKGISSTTTESNNLAGTVTISDTATFATVTFATAELDGQYRLAITPNGQTGTPAAGSNRVLRTVKSTTAFNVFIEAAPGAGNSVSFDWHLLR